MNLERTLSAYEWIAEYEAVERKLWGHLDPVKLVRQQTHKQPPFCVRYRPNDDEASIAMVVAKRRNKLNGGGTNIPGGEVATTDERLLQHYRACLSEISVSRITNLCWTGCGKGAHGLRDVGNVLEVRSIPTPNKGLLARGKDNDLYPCALVLVQDDRWCEVMGWEFFGNVKRNGRIIDGESESPCWILPAGELRKWWVRPADIE